VAVQDLHGAAELTVEVVRDVPYDFDGEKYMERFKDHIRENLVGAADAHRAVGRARERRR
jgi:hypothetical protein